MKMTKNKEANVLKMELNDADAVKLIRKVINDDSENVTLLDHAIKRKDKRNVNLKQIFTCLKKGRVVEPVHRTTRCDWQINLESICAGATIRVVVILTNNGNGNEVLIRTVIHCK